MTSIWRSLPVLAAVCARPVTAQTTLEAGGQALVTTADPALVTGGLYGAVRASSRMRLAATAGLGVSDGRAAGRGELLAHFLLSPAAKSGTGVYFGGGVAGVVGAVDQGYVVALVGLEAAPGGRSGWAIEAGVGGGVRLTAGWRWRRAIRKH